MKKDKNIENFNADDDSENNANNQEIFNDKVPNMQPVFEMYKTFANYGYLGNVHLMQNDLTNQFGIKCEFFKIVKLPSKLSKGEILALDPDIVFTDGLDALDYFTSAVEDNLNDCYGKTFSVRNEILTNFPSLKSDLDDIDNNYNSGYFNPGNNDDDNDIGSSLDW